MIRDSSNVIRLLYLNERSLSFALIFFCFQILELYVFGYDDLADELLEKASERERIVKQLLDISARRLTLNLDQNKSNWRHVATGGSLLTNYLETIQNKTNDAMLENVKISDFDRLFKLSYKTFQIASSKNFSDSRILK